MLRGSSENNLIDQQTRIVINRIGQTEKFNEDLGQGLAAYTRKSARLRDKLDDLSRIILENKQCNSNVENSSLTIDEGLVQLGQELTNLADLRDLEINQISSVISELSQSGQVANSMREEVKINQILRRRAQRRGSTVLRADRDFEKIVEEFEHQKNKDLKELMLSFVQIQLKIHLDGANRLTEIYRKLTEIDCQEDAIKFRDEVLGSVEMDNMGGESKLTKVRSQSMGALNNLMHPQNPFRRRAKFQLERLNKSQEDVPEAIPRAQSGALQEPPKITLTQNETEDDSGEEEEEESNDETTETDQDDFRKRHLSIPKL